MDNRNTPPGRVSPTIKPSPFPSIPGRSSRFLPLTRWGFLLFGVAYGATRYTTLNKREKARLAELERTRPQREAKEKAEKLRALQEQEELLSSLMGSPVSGSKK